MAKAKEPNAKKPRRLTAIKVNTLGLVDNPAVPDAGFVIAKRDEPVSDEITIDIEKAGGKAVEEALLKAIKGLRGVAGQMDENGLRMLSELMSFAKFSYPGSESMKSMLGKSITTEPTDIEGVTLVKCDFGDDVTTETFWLDKAGAVLNKANAAKVLSAHKALGEVIGSAKLATSDDADKGDGKKKPNPFATKKDYEDAIKRGAVSADEFREWTETEPAKVAKTALELAAEELAKQEADAKKRDDDEQQTVLDAITGLRTDVNSAKDEVKQEVTGVYRELAKARGTVFDDELKDSDAA